MNLTFHLKRDIFPDGFHAFNRIDTPRKFLFFVHIAYGPLLYRSGTSVYQFITVHLFLMFDEHTNICAKAFCAHLGLVVHLSDTTTRLQHSQACENFYLSSHAFLSYIVAHSFPDIQFVNHQGEYIFHTIRAEPEIRFEKIVWGIVGGLLNTTPSAAKQCVIAFYYLPLSLSSLFLPKNCHSSTPPRLPS